MKPLYDDRLLSVEILNINKHRITAVRDEQQDWYVERAGKPLGPKVVILEPNHRYLLPHHFYRITHENSSEMAPVLAIYGDKIGTGETKASRPEAARSRLY